MRRKLVLTIILASLISSLLIGCSQPTPPQATPAQPETALAPPQATPVPSPEPVPVQPTEPPTGFYLEVLQPPDGGIVEIDKVEIRGHTSPGAVVSVNGEIAVADNQGAFALTIALEEGPNIIEVIASDEEGNEARANLTITLAGGG